MYPERSHPGQITCCDFIEVVKSISPDQPQSLQTISLQQVSCFVMMGMILQALFFTLFPVFVVDKDLLFE